MDSAANKIVIIVQKGFIFNPIHVFFINNSFIAMNTWNCI